MAALAGEPGDEGRSRLSDLVEAVRSLADARSAQEIAEVVRTAARRVAGADGATFVLRRGDECQYVDEDAISPLWKGRSFPMSECVSGWSMLHRAPVAIPDIYDDDRVPHDAYHPTFVRSMVMVPIRTADPVGAIGTYWASRHDPSVEEVGLLQALADSTAVAMENVSLHSDLEARVAGRTARLTAANEDLRRFTSVLAHDIRQPLTTINGYAELLRSRYEQDLPPQGRAMLVALQRAGRNLANFVVDLQEYATASATPALFEALAMEDLVGCVVARLGHEIESRGANVVYEGVPDLVADRALLSQALQNLVSNALNYTPEGRDPEVCIVGRALPTTWELSVADNGVGVSSEDRQRIFEPFVRASSGNGRPGTGLGLALCRRVAEQHGGSIRVEDAPTGGAAFVIELPRREPFAELRRPPG